MFGWLFHGDIRREISRGVKELDLRVTHVKDLAMGDGNGIHPAGSDPLTLAYREVRRHARQILTETRRTGRIPIEAVRMLKSNVRNLQRLMSGEATKRQRGSNAPHPSSSAFLQACNKACSACRGLYEVLERHEKQLNEQSPQFEDARTLRSALLKIDRSVGRSADLLGLDQWLNTAPSLNWNNPLQVQRMAKIYILALVSDQSWDVRYRSRAPGHPLVFVAELSWFPTYDDLAVMVQGIGADVDFFVAATRPRWRVAWQYSAEN